MIGTQVIDIMTIFDGDPVDAHAVDEAGWSSEPNFQFCGFGLTYTPRPNETELARAQEGFAFAIKKYGHCPHCLELLSEAERHFFGTI